jgi:AcrR family transcriptional regulator
MRDNAPEAGGERSTLARSRGGRSRPTLTREDWIRAALRTMRENGARRVAVEPLADSLGATKGSFYWHFKDRGALIDAALDTWERESTDEVIEALCGIVDSRERLAEVKRWRLAEGTRDDVLLAMLLWEADSPAIVARVRRVIHKRIDFMVRLRADMSGGPEERVRAAVTVAYSMWLGVHLMSRAIPELLDDISTERIREDWERVMARE